CGPPYIGLKFQRKGSNLRTDYAWKKRGPKPYSCSAHFAGFIYIRVYQKSTNSIPQSIGVQRFSAARPFFCRLVSTKCLPQELLCCKPGQNVKASLDFLTSNRM